MKQLILKKLLALSVCTLPFYCLAQTNRFPDTGNVGIGTTTPAIKLTVVNDYGSGNSGYITKVGGKNHWAINDWEGLQLGFSHLHSIYEGNSLWGLRFSTGGSADAQVNEVMRVSGNGRVGIGTANPTEKLSVNGNIRAKEIKVETANWADYVFDDAYQMKSLAEVEAFINANKHLPGIPSEREVKENGVELGEMNRKLLEKVEELTLYLIKEKVSREELARHYNERIETLEKKLELLSQEHQRN